MKSTDAPPVAPPSRETVIVALPPFSATKKLGARNSKLPAPTLVPPFKRAM